MSKYSKFWVALAAGLTVMGVVLSDGKVSPAEWFQVAAAVLGPFGVYQVKNKAE